MKKMLLLVMAFTLFFAFTVPQVVDAKRGGGLKSPRQSVTTPKKPAENVQQTNPNTPAGGAVGGAAGGAANRGFMGGGLMRGLMIGGLAGLMFGGLFAGMGAFGEVLGLLVNVLAIVLLFVAIRGIIRYFRNRNRYDDNRRPY